jgi:putative radical SAM enzyme (TIGR03279 family)
MPPTIRAIQPGSPASRTAIAPGDRLRRVNGRVISDVLDYTYAASDRRLLLEVERRDGGLLLARVKKGEGEDLGLEFETFLMDEARSCANRCLFCFVDQLPRGMRPSLYYKDDDARLSFLQGNYVTLTNLPERELQRIIDLKISPINVSVHSMNPETRGLLLGNRRGGEGVGTLRRLAAAGITMNCQIVCCPGINDGESLSESMAELAALYPEVGSVSVVPVGLTRHRAGLPELTPFDAARARETVARVERFAAACVMLGGAAAEQRDVSYDLPLTGGNALRLILREGDEEFPASSQILFSDNIVEAWTAEDLAVLGEVAIRALTEVTK